jgi:hypothetical protein
LGEGGGDGAVIFDEPAVIARHPKEAAETANRVRLRPSRDGVDLVAVHGDSLGRDHVVEVSHRRLREGALGALEPQLVFPEGGEDGVEVLEMRGPRWAVDEDVIKKHEHELTEERAQHGVHQALECGRCIREPKRHDQELEVAFVSAESHFLHVVDVHPHFMVAGTQVQLREEARSMELVQQLLHNGYRELILHRLLIQGAVVHAKAP